MEDRPKPTIHWINIAAIVSLAAGLLYLYGDTYKISFLREFNLSLYLFTESFEQTLVSGFRLALFAPLKHFKSILIFLAVISVLSGVIYSATWIVPKVTRRSLRFLILLMGHVLSLCVLWESSFFITISLWEMGRKMPKN